MSLDALYRATLRLLPRDFRRRHGEEMARLARERRRDVRQEAGRWAELRLWGGSVLDVARTAAAERWDRIRGRSPRPPGTYDELVTTTGGGMMTGLGSDLALAWRTLRRNPGFTAVSALTIALAIGATTAIFSVIRPVLLAPLPYPESQRLVHVVGELRNRGVHDFPTSPPDLREFRTATDAFEELAGVFTFSQPLTGDGDPVQVQVAGVTEGFFRVLGVQPLIGRDFGPRDFDPGPEGVQPGDPAFLNASVLLSHHAWQQRWGGDPAVVGRIIDVGGTPSEVVGILPPDFRFLMPPSAGLSPRPDLFIAARIDVDQASRNNVFLRVVGRLAPGVDLARARAEMDRVASDLRARYPIAETAGYYLHVRPLQSELSADARPVILALAGAVALVLLVACANVSNLLLVRAAGRGREMAVRAAMGGGRGRLIRQLLLESLVLGTLGGLGGLALASLGTDALLALQPGNVPRMGDARIDLPVLAFTAGAVLVATLLFGLVPALHASRTDVAGRLRNRSPAGSGPSGWRLRQAIVVGEVALSLVLLVGAGLLVRSFSTLQRVDPGFRPQGVLTFQVDLPMGRYPDPGDRHRFNTELRNRLEALPTVQSATAAYPLPLDGNVANVRWGPEEALETPELYQQADAHFVEPGYFETLGTGLRAGRSFTPAEADDSAAVVVLDEILAQRAFPEGEAVGKLFLARVISPEPRWHRVVGVVEHQRHGDLAREGRGSAYFTARFGGTFGGTWAVHAPGADPASLLPQIRALVSEMDPLLPVSEADRMTAWVGEARAPARFALILMGGFAGLAGLLAALGLYGVLAHLVRQRRGEIGIRMALGAPRESVLRGVVGRGLRLTLLGVAAGLVGALLLSRTLASLLVEIQPRDPLTFAAVTAGFVVVATAACAIPALRASRVDPARALRSQE